MKNKKMMQKRDMYLIGGLLILFGALFFLFNYVLFAGDAVTANIYYGIGEPLVTVDFTSQEVIRHQDQDVESDISYPLIINDESVEYIQVIVLGDYEIDGVRQEVVIEVDFTQNRVRVASEESPLNVCSKQGWSTAVPLICLPNRVRVEFDADQSEIDFIQ